MEHILQFDWCQSEPDIDFVKEEDLDHCVTERILRNKFHDPLVSSDSEEEKPIKIDWDQVFSKKQNLDKSHQIFVPCLLPLPQYPKQSALTDRQHYQCIKVLCAQNMHVLEQKIIPQPTKNDYQVFEELKPIYEKEQKEYIEWAKSLWTTTHCVRALRPKPMVETVYEAIFKLKLHEMQCYPSNYELAAQIPLETRNSTFDLVLEEDLINVDLKLLPKIDDNISLTKKFSIMKTCSVPKPCKEHPCRFILPNEKSVSILPLTGVHRELAQYALERGASCVASEDALRCLVEPQRVWDLAVAVHPAIAPDGEQVNILVLGDDFSFDKESPLIRTYTSFKHMLEQALILPSEKLRHSLGEEDISEDEMNNTMSVDMNVTSDDEENGLWIDDSDIPDLETDSQDKSRERINTNGIRSSRKKLDHMNEDGDDGGGDDDGDDDCDNDYGDDGFEKFTCKDSDITDLDTDSQDKSRERINTNVIRSSREKLDHIEDYDDDGDDGGGDDDDDGDDDCDNDDVFEKFTCKDSDITDLDIDSQDKSGEGIDTNVIRSSREKLDHIDDDDDDDGGGCDDDGDNDYGDDGLEKFTCKDSDITDLDVDSQDKSREGINTNGTRSSREKLDHIDDDDDDDGRGGDGFEKCTDKDSNITDLDIDSQDKSREGINTNGIKSSREKLDHINDDGGDDGGVDGDDGDDVFEKCTAKDSDITDLDTDSQDKSREGININVIRISRVKLDHIDDDDDGGGGDYNGGGNDCDNYDGGGDDGDDDGDDDGGDGGGDSDAGFEKCTGKDSDITDLDTDSQDKSRERINTNVIRSAGEKLDHIDDNDDDVDDGGGGGDYNGGGNDCNDYDGDDGGGDGDDGDDGFEKCTGKDSDITDLDIDSQDKSRERINTNVIRSSREKLDHIEDYDDDSDDGFEKCTCKDSDITDLDIDSQDKSRERINTNVIRSSREKLDHIEDYDDDSDDGFEKCTCKDTIFERPPRRSFRKWKVTNKTTEESLSVLIHCAHRVQDKQGEVLLEPSPEYQLELGASEMSEGRLKSLALAMHLRKNATLAHFRINGCSGDIATVEHISSETFRQQHGGLMSDVTNCVHSALAQLQGLLPGNYVLRHEPSHGANALLYRPDARCDALTRPDDDALQLSTPPALGTALLPYHKFRRMLPCAFTPHERQVRRPPDRASARHGTEAQHSTAARHGSAARPGKAARRRTPPRALQWPKKKRKKVKN